MSGSSGGKREEARREQGVGRRAAGRACLEGLRRTAASLSEGEKSTYKWD